MKLYDAFDEDTKKPEFYAIARQDFMLRMAIKIMIKENLIDKYKLSMAEFELCGGYVPNKLKANKEEKTYNAFRLLVEAHETFRQMIESASFPTKKICKQAVQELLNQDSTYNDKLPIDVESLDACDEEDDDEDEEDDDEDEPVNDSGEDDCDATDEEEGEDEDEAHDPSFDDNDLKIAEKVEADIDEDDEKDDDGSRASDDDGEEGDDEEESAESLNENDAEEGCDENEINDTGQNDANVLTSPVKKKMRKED